jgi:hypothetical protein
MWVAVALSLASALAPPVTPPWCLPAATAEALRFWGTSPDARSIARELPMTAQGADLFDVRQWLQEGGWSVAVLEPSLRTIQGLVRGGRPVILVRTTPDGPHAVALLHGDARIVEVHDNLATRPLRLPWRHALRGAIVAMTVSPQRVGMLAPLSRPAQAAVVARDAHFVATGWFTRAQQYNQPCHQQIELLRRALEADPCLAAARSALVQAAPAWPAATEVLARARPCGVQTRQRPPAPPSH